MDQSELKPYEPGNPHLFGHYLDSVMGYTRKPDWSHLHILVGPKEVSRPFLFVVANHSLFCIYCSIIMQIFHYDCISVSLLSNTRLVNNISVFWTLHWHYNPGNMSKYTFGSYIIAWKNLSKSFDCNSFYAKQLDVCTKSWLSKEHTVPIRKDDD